ncbi:hypothetical protein P153DRAFT_347724 [Dothidotthia symphoricarpi CBS 119687]|uniref:Uncharacterized protein n=1 Tax=Dothidotthia symphoricarpi CBS 119687 TaxID=1392245 RepID=A0A6A6A1L0_9PLEO|nr:uncharacterized protein P153DRAFT_347724 [Dothidotthia symphoricarpi CBS 119687]KAF2125729.1 hypothetical protein P153DRAFT_347724 [Dothidotthia symphoricarpi CBS 119687]
MATDDGLPWTTSRCNRLLRPLSSKLAKLRKELARPRSNGETRSASTAFATRGSPNKTTNFTRPAHKPRGFEKARDPDWRPGPKSGAASKKTYGGRGGRKTVRQGGLSASSVARPGEIAFTPLIARMGGQFQSSPQLQHSPLRKYGKASGPLLASVDRIQNLVKQLPSDLQKLVQGLSEAYANLLQATMAGSEKRWKGTRSLMGACLRKLPAYIELEEHFAKLDQEEEENEDEAEDRDVAKEVYEHLEGHFEQRSGQGWYLFKQVVRAHGTSLICDAIADEVLGLESLSILVTHCLNVSAWDEAEQILVAYLPLLDVFSLPINTRTDLFDGQRSLYMSSVMGFVERTGRYRFLYDLLDHLIAYELLPLEWLATECMRPLWDRLVRTISENDYRTLAQSFRFLETTMFAGMGLPDARLLEDEVIGSIARRFVPSSKEELRQALNTTFSSLITVLCSIALVNNSRDDSTGKVIAERVTWTLDALSIALTKRRDIRDELHLLGADTEDSQVFARRALWTTFASFLVHLDGCRQDSTMISLDPPTLVTSINTLTVQYSSNGISSASLLATLPALISSTARGTGRIWKDDGFGQLQRLVQALMTLSGCRLPHKSWTLKRLALESVMEFAQSTGEAEHMAYAREIEKKMHSQGRLVILPTPQKTGSPSAGGGFRWEEGIGEWVACTPFAKQDITRLQRQPLRALELLPTPIQSEDEENMGEEHNESSMWETTAFEQEDDDVVPQSSPIKRARPRVSTSSLGKRTRASSPIVVIVKRTCITPPDSPVKFYPELPEEKEEDRVSEGGLRRSRRSTYEEVDPNTSSESDGENESESENSEDSQKSSGRRNSKLRLKRSCSSSGKRSRSTRGQDDDEHDELSKTPARPRRRRASGRKSVSGRKGWIVNDDDEEEYSADELSFL